MLDFIVCVGMFDLCIYTTGLSGCVSVSRLVFIVPDCIIMTRLVATNYTNYILSPQKAEHKKIVPLVMRNCRCV